MDWFIQNFIIDELHNKKYNPDAGLFQGIKNSSVANNIDNQTLVILILRVWNFVWYNLLNRISSYDPIHCRIWNASALRCRSTEHKLMVACNSLIRDHFQCDTRDISKPRTACTSNSQSNQHLCHSHLLYSIKVRGVLGHYILIYSWTEIITATIKFGLPPPSPHSPTQQSQGLSMEYDPPHCPLYRWSDRIKQVWKRRVWRHVLNL